MTSIELKAPAKVNLFLKVLGKRSDSYHNIFTIFERIDLSDTIKITRTSGCGVKLITDKFITKRPEDNIAYKAAGTILKRSGIEGGVKIAIKKRIPIAAGLGGGSSDAAAVLLGINKLFNLNIAKKELIRMGSRLGADVPFFILNRPFAVGEGVGEKLKEIKSKTRLWHLLIYPGFKVETKGVYKAFDTLPRHLTKRYGDVKIQHQFGRTCPDDHLIGRGILHNDLEAASIIKRPILGRIKKSLTVILGDEAIVSGSGPSLFCLYETRKEAMAARNKLYRYVPQGKRRHWQIFVTKTKN